MSEDTSIKTLEIILAYKHACCWGDNRLCADVSSKLVI